MIEIKNLVKKYATKQGEIIALNDINLKIKKGEIFGIIGPSGAGKSTLIRTINLLEKPTGGKILLNGKDMVSLRATELRRKRRKIGMIFQHFNLLSSRTVWGNIAFPLEITGISDCERAKRVDKLIDLVGLADRADYYPSQLSGGQKQRVGIARALANKPELLLSDEATSSLDPESTESILNLLARIRKEMNLTILLITHEMEVIKQVCDQVAVMERGRIIEQGKVIDLFANPQQPLTKRFIKSIIDFNLPPRVIKYLKSNKQEIGEMIRVSFIGESTHQSLISSLVKAYKLDANILYGNIDEIQGVPFGTLILELEGKYNQIIQGLKYLKEQGLTVEVLKDDRTDKYVS